MNRTYFRRRRFGRKLIKLLGFVLITITGAGFFLAWQSRQKIPTLGVFNEQSLPCSNPENCVCSHANDESGIESLPWEGDLPTALEQIKEIVTSNPRNRLMQESDNYLRFACATSLFGFIDDLEFLVDTQSKQIHVRSGSRVGYSDLGANRKRVEEFRQQWQADRSIPPQ